ncbi:efflux RND transporter permease subunit [Bacteroides sp. 224]|uniref:efflux RND transporter permease subunit n=1 Tax=Bacteroides sp. 224 TaxID=2302936 RepID=UPI0013D0A885|nr:efflux RND transporter permease subunit [Bacteroides sp. 224]NDV65517.1 efflux RND transporter permease subunit [Bacteroides sp. 224]
MIRYIVNHPISVIMVFVALFILGIITYINIPVSLLPDIAIPEMTVQVSASNTSARQLENTVVRPLRQQLMQVGKLRNIYSETRDGNGVIHLSFEYGTDTDLAFIEVNEKIDGAMNYLPKESERPRVIKASATDIPVFNLALTLQADSCFEETDMPKFMELSDFAESVIRRRFEQLPQVAMIDISGLVKKQILISPNEEMMEVSGITLSDIEGALNNNNSEPGSMTVREGYYEYVIRFSSVLRTIEDVQHIYIRKHDRIYQLKDLATVAAAPEKEKGMVIYNGKRAILLSVIKQSEENMSDMQKTMNKEVERFREEFPEIEMNMTQNQTELLDYTISNLQQNLLLAFLFVFFVSVFFLKDSRLSVIIGLALFVSLIISLLFFYLFRISLNVVSLTGLILASGNMIDNSIVAADNISQYRQRGFSIPDACVVGTKEISLPMLSSALTNISVFIPLIFMSGIAGSLFSDQAFSVTIGLMISYLTGIMLIPVLYKLIYRTNHKAITGEVEAETLQDHESQAFAFRMYDAGIQWVFSHKVLTGILILGTLPLCVLLFIVIPKEKMPDIKQNELLINIDWNENIHLQENYQRCLSFGEVLTQLAEETSTLVGEQQFALNRDKEQTSGESQFYVRTQNAADILPLKDRVLSYFKENYPLALVSFSPTGTIFEKIFSTGEADLVVEYYATNKATQIEPATIRQMEHNMETLTGESFVGNAFQRQLDLHINREKLLLYNVSYDWVYRALRTAFKENRFATLRSQQQYLPVVLGGEEKEVHDILHETLIEVSSNPDGTRNKVPLSSFVSVTQSEDLKKIVAGKSGEYIPFYYNDTQKPEQIMEKVEEEVLKDRDWEVEFSGTFFSNRKMINEMIVIMFVSILLMFFILSAQFGNFKQPFIILFEIPIDITFALALLLITGHSLNLMSAIGLIVTTGIIINDSILKVDVMNQLRKEGFRLMDAIHEAGRRRLKAILMTSFTSIVCMVPLLFTNDLGSQLEKPLAIATIGGMLIGTPVSLFVVPLIYWLIYRKEEKYT